MHSILLHKSKVPYTETNSWYRVPKIIGLFAGMLIVAYLSVLGWGGDNSANVISSRSRMQTNGSLNSNQEWRWEQTALPNNASLVKENLGGRNLPRWEVC